MMIRSVVQDQHQATIPSAVTQELPKEAAEAEALELGLRPE
jgi:hypothetical protein